MKATQGVTQPIPAMKPIIQENPSQFAEKWLFWQHTQNGQVHDISAPVDLDRFRGDQKALQGLLSR